MADSLWQASAATSDCENAAAGAHGEFAGVAMIQAEPCVRYFDLAVDDVYVVRGVKHPMGVRDHLVLDGIDRDQLVEGRQRHPHKTHPKIKHQHT